MADPDFIPVEKSQDQPDFIPASGNVPAAKSATAESGFLDKEIPQTTTSDSFFGQLGDEIRHPLNPATLSGVQSIGRGVRSAVQGTGRLLAHPIDSIKSLGDLPGEIKEIPGAIHDINASPDPIGTYGKVAQDTAGEAAGQALTALATEGIARGVQSIPKSVTTAPVRAIARTGEGVVNSSPMRYVRSAGRLFTPADEARKMIRFPGRDLGLEALPSNPGAPLPERPLPAVMQARGLQTGGQSIEEPSEALARIPVHAAEPDALTVRPAGRIGGRYVLTPEEAQQAEQIQKIAKTRASQRGMQHAAGIRPSGGKITAP